LTPPARTNGRTSLAARIEDFFWRYLNRSLPKNRLGDYISAVLWFLRIQRRWPRPRRPLFNDRLFAIKTSGEIAEPLRVFTSDKEFVKLYVRATVGEAHNVPTLAVLRSLEECRHYEFPRRCVIKPTHMSGTVILRRNGEPVDLGLIERWFATNLYVESRESNYQHLAPKIIVEPFVFENDNPSDYKIFCADGRPGLIQVDSDRHSRHVRSFYDVQWRRQPFSMTYPPSDTDAPRPANLELMLDLAARLSSHFSFVRVDFYSDGEQALVGEITHCHGGAREYFVPRSAEQQASQLLFGASARP
jgi:hypothetical protein